MFPNKGIYCKARALLRGGSPARITGILFAIVIVALTLKALQIGLNARSTPLPLYGSHHGRFVYQKAPQGSASTLYVDHLYCITSPQNTHRRARLQSMFDHLDLDIEYSEGLVPMEDELALYSSVRVIPPYSLSHVIGCWKSHLRVWQDIVKSGYQTAMIFEDDIDLPLNIHAIMRTTIDILSANSSRSVPGSKDPGYDLVFVGGCGLRESTNPPLTSDFRLLRKSYWPSCLHAYMLTIDSARKLLQLFSTAISDPIDVSITEYVRNGTLRSYSLHPSVITQRRDLTPEGASWNYDVFKVPKYSLLEHLAKYGHVYSVDEAKNMGL